MNDQPSTPIAVVGIAAIMPDAPDAAAFWQNICDGRYSISDVPPERWDPGLYYDPDHAAPDMTYSKIGGWVREFPWEPRAWRLPIPPTVAAQMDQGQQWAVAASRAAMVDAGWPDWDVDPERVAVIFGNAIGGEKHYQTTLRIHVPEYVRALDAAPSFGALPPDVRAAVVEEFRRGFLADYPVINEDTMPGELSNVMAGRVSNLFNLRGPNFTTDAACASGLAAMSAAVQGLVAGEYDAAITGGVDRNMGVNAFVKFCKIGALSATGTRPFDAGADGFVMGEGCALFVLKRLADAERAGDRIYAVLLGLGGSSDGKGKGITAPNPVGQKLAVERAWANAGVKPAAASAVEAHGTSTRVGDAAELASLGEVFGGSGAAPGSIALGSVKSNIGHLKAAAGTAGLFKMVMQLHEKQLAPSLHFQDPNPNVDWDRTPFRVTTERREWPADPEGARRAGVSAFGFGGTNYHAVLEEYVPGRHRPDSASRTFAAADVPGTAVTAPVAGSAAAPTAPRPPLRGALVLGGRDDADVLSQLEEVAAAAAVGTAPPPRPPDPALAGAAVRVAIDFADATDLAAKAGKAVTAFRSGAPAMWKMLRAQGIHVGRGPAPKVAFLYTGQGSQYVNMLKDLRADDPVVAATFDEADRIMAPLLGRPLSSYIFIDQDDPAAVRELEQQLLQTEITQPAVLATDAALTRLLDAYGVRPDMVMGHSLGEYGALVAAGAMTFDAALEAVSARGHEMAALSLDDNGAMAAVFGPLPEIERIVGTIAGNVVIANINSTSQAVIGGATDAVERAVAAFQAAGMNAARIPVSHAFHTSIVAPASEPLRVALRRLDVHAPTLPIVANVTGDFYPADADTETMLDILGRQVASPVQFVRGLHTLHEAGARVFVEVGPKKALHGFVEDVLGGHDDVLALFTNHPKNGDVPSFNAALCGLWAAGLGYPAAREPAPTPPAPEPTAVATAAPAPATVAAARAAAGAPDAATATPPPPPGTPMTTDRYVELGRLFADALEQGLRVYGGAAPAATAGPDAPVPTAPAVPEPVVVTGAALGLPGVEQVFDDENLQRILDGQQFIDTIPHKFRRQMVDLRVTRLVKRESGDPTFETIDDEAEVVKLAGRHAPLDVVTQFGVDAARDAALDAVTRLAIGVGFDALRDAGIPLVMRYKTTTLGSSLPERWGLPDALRDDTGVIFASAFPGYDSFADDLEKYYTYRGRREQLLALEAVRARMQGGESALPEVDRRIAELRHLLEVESFTFDRRFLFRCLSMGHSQFAEIIGARGPNTQINAACASTTQALSLAEDWIRAGRCRRVVVVSADDVTTDTLLPWVASGFLASGAAATDDSVEDAATPFDRRRHGMIVGMGAASFVVESADAARERGLQPICEVLGAVTANSAFHGTRLDVTHIAQVMEDVVRQAESRGIDRNDVAASTVFVSHETYTPARGGSASAEINALRSTFGPQAESIVITNTKGFTGHAMGAGIEDVVAIKALETGVVPPVPNYKEPDPELGELNLSQGGAYPVRHALRLAAGFGSQIAMSLVRWTPVPDGRHRSPSELGYAYRIVDPQAWQRWLDAITGRPATRLDVEHIGQVMEDVVRQAEARGASRHEMAPATVFVSHETYTPARGGSAAAEINALRQVFGADAD
ncbi:MAG TPA: beta-ketoacyl synthase N-terminal-like domain-containing protein, partial [Jiangellales bacterium]|nr:beta-ketoacyl synthase N-terminal-like domain-containing protein [Jiangellales bacterium]